MEERASDNLAILTPIEELDKHVPMKALQELIDEVSGNQEHPKHATKDSLLDEVKGLIETKELSLEQVNKLVQNYKFAGRVSVCWGIPLHRVTLSKQSIQKKIIDRSPINSFEEELKPQLTEKPAFNKAEWFDNNLLRLEFAYAGKSYEVEDNYEKRTIIPTKRINSYIRLLDKTFVVETRASIRESKLVHDSIFLLLGIEIVPMTFSNQDIAFLKQELHAKSKAAKHKRFGGDLDTVYVSASPELDDLENSEEYKQNFTHGELRETRLEFVYTTSSKQKVDTSVHVSNQGNIWFMTDVPEELIEYTFSIVRKIKFLPPVGKLGLISKVSRTDEDNIQSLIASIRKNGYGNRFHPRIYKTLEFEIDEKKWMQTISKLVQLEYLTERFELVCPACHETVKIYHEYKDIPLDEVVNCSHCGHDFKVSEQEILLTYSFKEDMEPSYNTEAPQTEAQFVLAKV
jgi:DNA-directed RNA polymerase subunit M/transcription elongation factor TFIIS